MITDAAARKRSEGATTKPTAQFLELARSQHGTEESRFRLKTLSSTKFWRMWNHPVRVVDWCITVPDRDGKPYTVKWWSISYQSNGVGRVTDTSVLVTEGVHPHTGAGDPQSQD